jgi:hypothetical protein
MVDARTPDFECSYKADIGAYLWIHGVLSIATVLSFRSRVRCRSILRYRGRESCCRGGGGPVRIKTRADANVGNTFAQEMGQRRQEVVRAVAFRNNAVFVPTEAMGGVAPPAVAIFEKFKFVSVGNFSLSLRYRLGPDRVPGPDRSSLPKWWLQGVIQSVRPRMVRRS